MAVQIRAEYSKDRIKFKYEIKNCDGIKDEYGEIEMTYSHAKNLPYLPKDKDGYYLYDEKFHIPDLDGFIVFLEDRIRETASGYWYSLRGPYYDPKPYSEKN